MTFKTIHPDLSPDKRQDLHDYLFTMWRQAKEGRTGQVDDDYKKWSDAYEGVPLEEVRTVPFYKASNFVVKLIRIYIDTFVARTLNVMFATQPLYVCDGMPKEFKDEFELYLNRKASFDWDHYWVGRNLCFRGNKNGTVVFKIPHVETKTIDVTPSPGEDTQTFTEEEVTLYSGPQALPIPFEDFYVYPLEINKLSEALIKFHRTRYVKEAAEQKVENGDWHLPDDKTIDSYLQHHTESKRDATKSNANITDSYTQSIHVIESYLDFAIMDGSTKRYCIVVLMEEQTGDIFDVYFNPYPYNLEIFIDYRPFPREDFLFGESLCSILGQSQEEASRIHNERRDNSTIASSVCFKRRNGSLLPNPSTNWYPGKVWDLDDMDDLEVITVGRNYEDMIVQEDYVFNFADRLSGIGEVMQGSAQGGINKRGIYNTSGTLAVIAEGNQRQDTNMRDVRDAMGRIALTSCRIQAYFDPNDSLIDTLPKSSQEGVRKALAWIASPASRYIRLEVKASNAGANAEITKANLTTIAGILRQYAADVQQMGAALMDQSLSPGLRMMMNDILSMYEAMTRQLLKAYNEVDFVDELPDIKAAIEAVVPGGSRGTTPTDPGGGSQSLLPRATPTPQGPNPGGGMATVNGVMAPPLGGGANIPGVGPQNLP